MNKDLHFVEQLFQDILDTKPSRVEAGYGSFITMDFGNDIPKQINTRTGPKTLYFGEWHLWVYMCAWRIDKNKKPFLGSNDPKELIEIHVKEIEKRVLKKVEILNEAFDVKLNFNNDLELFLFSFNTTENEQWMFFTPNNVTIQIPPPSSGVNIYELNYKVCKHRPRSALLHWRCPVLEWPVL